MKKLINKEIINSNIELLEKLDSILQSKVQHLKDMATEILQNDLNKLNDFNIQSHNTLHQKVSGIRIAKEEIRREILNLQEELKSL